MKYPSRNGEMPRQEINVGKFYLTRFEDKPQSIFIENEIRESIEVPYVILEMLLRKFWEANNDDLE